MLPKVLDMSNRPEENRVDRFFRLWDAVHNYKTSVEFLPLNGGKIIIPDDIQFLLEEIKRLEAENEQLRYDFDNAWR
jgi:hypothetical protein